MPYIISKIPLKANSHLSHLETAHLLHRRTLGGVQIKG